MNIYDFRALAIDSLDGEGILGLTSSASSIDVTERVALRLTTDDDALFGGSGGNSQNDGIIQTVTDLTNDSAVSIVDSGFVSLTITSEGTTTTGTYLFLATEDPAAVDGANGFLVDISDTGALDELNAGTDLAALIDGAVAPAGDGFGDDDQVVLDDIATWRERGAVSDGATAVEARSVAYLYGAAFNRDPDFAGLNFWIDRYEDGMSLTEISENFLGSTEFQTLYGGTASLSNSEFLEQIYLNTLNRASDDAGFAFWLGVLDDGLSRAEVMTYFASSPEYTASSTDILGLDESSQGVWHLVEMSADVAGTATDSAGAITNEPYEDYAYQTSINDGTTTTNADYETFLDGTGSGLITWDSTTRYITGDGIPDYETDGGGSPGEISAQDVDFEVPLIPTPNDEITYYNVPTTFGVAVNSVQIEPFAAEWFNGDGDSGWQEDPFVTLADFDFSNAHTQGDGTYHYHGVPEGIIEDLPTDVHSPIIGWAADGFPIYSHHLYEDPFDANSDIITFESSYELLTGTRPDGPGGTYDGTYNEDYTYSAALSELDELNGRWAVTPEYPDGTYYYVATDDFPYISRGFLGEVDESFIEIIGQRPPPDFM